MPFPSLSITIVASVAAGGCIGAPTPSTEVAGVPSDEIRVAREAWGAWHADRIRRLTAEDGWLTLIDLAFLDEGVTSIGNGAESDLCYERLTAERIGRLVKAGDEVRFEVEPAGPGATPVVVTADAKPAVSVVLVADDQGEPTVLRNGPISMILVRRNDRLALRVRDNESPVRREFPGVERFPFDPALRVPARVEQPVAGAMMSVTNVLGHTVDQPLAATLVFAIEGREFRLGATQASPGVLFVVFGDTTNGVGTHGGGRFLSVPVGDDGSAMVDFNRAYNPPCAFTDFSTCELPSAGNRLPIPIAAGERVAAAASP